MVEHSPLNPRKRRKKPPPTRSLPLVGQQHRQPIRRPVFLQRPEQCGRYWCPVQLINSLVLMSLLSSHQCEVTRSVTQHHALIRVMTVAAVVRMYARGEVIALIIVKARSDHHFGGV